MSNQVYTSIYKVKNVKELKDIEKWRNNTFDSPVKHGKNHDDEFSKLKKSKKIIAILGSISEKKRSYHLLLMV